MARHCSSVTAVADGIADIALVVVISVAAAPPIVVIASVAVDAAVAVDAVVTEDTVIAAIAVGAGAVDAIPIAPLVATLFNSCLSMSARISAIVSARSSRKVLLFVKHC